MFVEICDENFFNSTHSSFSGVPEFVLGLAMDCGVMWALDWCPSGARDILNPENTNEMLRLGLVAIASANGSAYVFPVPHPSTIKEK